MSRRPIRLLARLLPLALLVAQFGAEAHAFSHLRPDPDGIPSSTQSCATCLSFAPVTGGVGAATAPAISDPCLVGLESLAPADSFVSQSPLSAYQSRAPPSLL